MKVGIVIILFHPDIAHLQTVLLRLKERDARVVLVDNSPDALSLPFFDNNLSYIHLPANEGIACAQNHGIRLLVNEHFSHIALFDQDSDITGKLLDGLISGFNEAAKRFDNVAAVGPQVICEFHGQPVKPKLQQAIKVNGEYAEVKQIIASGMLLSAESFRRVGGKEESLFIDGVDHEWCWRARNKGFSIIKLLDVTMLHRQGDGRHKVLGITFKRGAPIRLYFQARNILILSRRNYVPLYWKLRNLPALPLRWMVNRWIFEDGQARGRFFLKGLQDGMKGKTGRLD